METGCILAWGCGVASVDVFFSFHLELEPWDSLFRWAPSTCADLSPLEATPPSTHPAEFHVCPHPQGTLSKFTLGQLGSSHGPVNALRVEGGGGRRGWVVGRGTHASTWENKGLGKGISRLPIFPSPASPGIDRIRICSVFAGCSPPIQRFLLSCLKATPNSSAS